MSIVLLFVLAGVSTSLVSVGAFNVRWGLASGGRFWSALQRFVKYSWASPHHTWRLVFWSIFFPHWRYRNM